MTTSRLYSIFDFLRRNVPEQANNINVLENTGRIRESDYHILETYRFFLEKYLSLGLKAAASSSDDHKDSPMMRGAAIAVHTPYPLTDLSECISKSGLLVSILLHGGTILYFQTVNSITQQYHQPAEWLVRNYGQQDPRNFFFFEVPQETAPTARFFVLSGISYIWEVYHAASQLHERYFAHIPLPREKNRVNISNEDRNMVCGRIQQPYIQEAHRFYSQRIIEAATGKRFVDWLHTALNIRQHKKTHENGYFMPPFGRPGVQ